ncbi:MAG: CCA tRNA nucleotidyltransferase [Anaerolineae bacterium]|nr:CCA tRNA nucleotidyltransferase [Anaerolineae bacterium]
METKTVTYKMVELIPKGSTVEQICAFLRARSVEAYLVGGCVRDWLLGRSSHDIDFAVAGDAVELARRVADRMGGAFVLLDQERCTGRVVTRGEDGQRLFIDFAQLQGDDIITDLSKRDFTVNAIAVAVADAESLTHVIDPYDGRRDVQLGLVRAVSETAFQDDPLRTLRAVRLAAEMGASIEQRTEELLRRAVHLIANVSAERVRDELGKILALPGAAQSLRYLDELGLLMAVIPELETLKGVEQSPPHYLDVFEHSLETVRWLEEVIRAVEGYEGQSELSLLPLFLSPFSRQLIARLSQPISGDRSRLTVLKLVALLHDLGKPVTKSFDDEGGVHFYGHEGEGAEMVGAVLRRLRFGGNEVSLAKTIVANHMRPCLLAREKVVTRRAVYRFFRDTGEAGVDTLLLYLADHLATWGPDLRMARWRRRVEFVASMLADYYERHQKVISPPKLISGHDLMDEFGLEEGPRIGELLEAVREAQVEGEVKTKEEALALVEGLLAQAISVDPKSL